MAMTMIKRAAPSRNVYFEDLSAPAAAVVDRKPSLLCHCPRFGLVHLRPTVGVLDRRRK
jgi:hypothetical protein